MSKELELSGKTPLTKSEIEALSIDLLNPVLEGEVDPVSHVVKLKALQETIKRTLDDDRMKTPSFLRSRNTERSALGTGPRSR